MKRVSLFCVIVVCIISLCACRNSTYNADNSYIDEYVSNSSGEQMPTSIKTEPSTSFSEPKVTGINKGTELIAHYYIELKCDNSSQWDSDAVKSVLHNRLTEEFVDITSIEYSYDGTYKIYFTKSGSKESIDSINVDNIAQNISKRGSKLKFVKGSDYNGELIVDSLDIDLQKTHTIIDRASVDIEWGSQKVIICFNNHGKELLAKATTEIASYKGIVSVWLDDECLTAPTISEPLTDGQCSLSIPYSAERKIYDGELPFAFSIVKAEKQSEDYER